MSFDLLIPLVLLALGYGFGRYAEKRHYASIRRREEELRHILLIQTRHLPQVAERRNTELVCGSVVISVDYFKAFLAGLRSLLGGRVRSYETLLDRGRREALLRLKEQAQAKGAGQVFNIKLQTASISRGGGDSIGSIEVIAYGTAVWPMNSKS